MGKLLILISAFCFSFSSYFGKVVTLSTSMSAVITSFNRFLFGTIIMTAYIIVTKKSFKPNNLKKIMIRAILNCTSIIIFSWSFKYTTTTNANMLNMIYPVFIILLNPFITREKLKKSNLSYLIIIMIGSYIISNPSFANINIGDVGSLVSAAIAGLSVLALKDAIKYDEGYLIVFFTMLLGTFLNIPFAYKDIVSFEISGIIPVVLSALLGFAAQVFQTSGYKFVDSETGALVSTSRIIISALIGYFLLTEPLNIRIIIGMLLITLSLIGISGYFDKFRVS